MLDVIVMAAALTLTAPAATASAKPAAAQPTSVSRASYTARMEAEFRQFDTDKDGGLTKKEVEDYELGVIRGQLEARRKSIFAALDTDHNGTLTAEEFARLPLPTPKVDASPLMKNADANHDGKVTLAEYQAWKLVNFDKLDKDKNGIVTPAELKAGGLIK